MCLLYLLPHPFLSLHTLIGERVLASGSVQLPRFTLLESGSLLISPSHISDAGTYTCMASNSRGIDEASADLVVWGERAGLNGPSHIFANTQTLGNEVVPYNGKDTKALLCASLESSLRCFLQEAIKKQKYNLAACHFIWNEFFRNMSCFFVLFFPSVVPTQEGDFVLAVFISVAFLICRSLLSFVFTARTRITTPPQDQSVIKGTKATMTCGVTHDPSVAMRWECIHKHGRIKLVYKALR